MMARGPRIRLEARARRLRLRRAWTIARGTSTMKTNVLVRLRAAGFDGVGEAAPNLRFGEDAASVRRAIARLARVLRERGPDAPWGGLFGALERAAGPDRAALAAVDIALHDRAGRRTGRPVWSLLGADPQRAPVTSFSIGLDTPSAMQERAREAADFPILKVKLDGRNDRAIIAAIRRVTDRPLFVDANESWTDGRKAVEMIRWLAGQGVVLVEQPMPAADLDGAKSLRDRIDLPLFADEAARTAADLPELADAYDGINIKVQKAGGLRAALRMLRAARRRGMRVMVGCMIETSVGITAAAHLAPLADHADLDGHLWLARDPFRGVRVERGRLILPDGPGLGVEPAR